MNIPNEVNIAGISIRVEFSTDLPEGCIGKADYQNQKIVINKDFAGRHLTEQTFYHELVHWILFVMGENELKGNERFVDLFSHFIYQAVGKQDKVQTTGKCLSSATKAA